MNSKYFTLFALTAFLFASSGLMAQANVTTPRPSPQATVTQTIGLTDITINYSRPAVKGREIWGDLVPWGLSPGAPFGNGNPYPWRAGANENTTISFSTEVRIGGTTVPAGIYGLHLIPKENEQWLLIFSKDYSAWGSYFYNDKNDLLRIPVMPATAEHQEWLMYGFEDISANSVTAFLHWETKKIPFTVKVDVQKTVVDNMRRELTSLAAFNWQATMNAANYCLQNNTNYEEALTWIDRSIGNNRQVNNLSVKAGLLEKMGRIDEAKTVKDEAWAFAKENGSENDINQVGYMFLTGNNLDEAMKAFKLNVKKYPNSWNVYDSLADGYDKQGNSAEAIKYYKMAHEKAPANQKARIEGILEKLEKKS